MTQRLSTNPETN